MARRFRRRKPRVFWLPNTGSLYANSLSADDQNAFIQHFETINLGSGQSPTIEIPLVLDNPQEGIASFAAYQGQTLGHEESFGYRLRRVVGDLHIALAAATNDAGSAPSLILCCAGLIIRRVSDDGTSPLPAEEVDTLNTQDIQDPWIWRRAWILTPRITIDVAGTTTIEPAPDSTDAASPFTPGYKQAAVDYTGMNNTVSMDAKTARRVEKEERLFLDITFRALGLPPDVQLAMAVRTMTIFDYRVLGSLHAGTGNRRNAVR